MRLPAVCAPLLPRVRTCVAERSAATALALLLPLACGGDRADPCSKMSMPLLAAVIVSGGQLHRVYYLSTTLAIIDALVALLGPVRNNYNAGLMFTPFSYRQLMIHQDRLGIVEKANFQTNVNWVSAGDLASARAQAVSTEACEPSLVLQDVLLWSTIATARNRAGPRYVYYPNICQLQTIRSISILVLRLFGSSSSLLE